MIVAGMAIAQERKHNVPALATVGLAQHLAASVLPALAATDATIFHQAPFAAEQPHAANPITIP